MEKSLLRNTEIWPKRYSICKKWKNEKLNLKMLHKALKDTCVKKTEVHERSSFMGMRDVSEKQPSNETSRKKREKGEVKHLETLSRK